MDSSLVGVALRLLAAFDIAMPLTIWHSYRFEQQERARAQQQDETQERQSWWFTFDRSCAAGFPDRAARA